MTNWQMNFLGVSVLLPHELVIQVGVHLIDDDPSVG